MLEDINVFVFVPFLIMILELRSLVILLGVVEY